MDVQLSFRGCFKTSAVKRKELHNYGSALKSDKNGRVQFCVVVGKGFSSLSDM